MENDSTKLAKNKALRSIINLFLFDKFDTPKFEIIEGFMMTSISDRLIEFFQVEDTNPFFDYLNNRLLNELSEDEKFSILQFIPLKYEFNLAMLMNFKINQESHNTVISELYKNVYTDKQTHPLFEIFLLDLLDFEEFQVYQMQYITKDWYEKTLISQFKKMVLH
ncbi:MULTISPECIES: hypothetical protein [unclassified Empedobacter]|uniref:hypothetical protein n=1 Tax=unclassified Empedobacter TaxID=2643773 RepID=UPI00244A9931|nr:MULTISPECIES: hypothetical protein [unclassified Empedobacter]MDH2208596.1 hypothetical protein [Empedobacter sp. GD03644]